MKTAAILLIALYFLGSAICGGPGDCTSHPRDPTTNEWPIWNDTHRLIKTVKNGKLYEIGEDSLNTTMKLIHVYGSMYDMGYAQGQLLGSELKEFLDSVWEYVESQITQVFPKWVPSLIADDVANFAASLALDLTHYATTLFTYKGYYDEIQGLADATGADINMIRRIQLIGELTKGSCSMFGAWGSATAENRTIQLRALDWDIDGPFRKHAAVIVYHPANETVGQTYANIGFVGWLGSISGVSANQLAISEIGVSYPDESFGKESRIGNPFTYVLRDILHQDKTLDEAIHRLKHEFRTCDLIFGVGDGKEGTFRGFQYSHSTCNVVDDQHPLPANDTWHPAIENVVYWAMDWQCVYWNERFIQYLNQYHGNITAYNTIRHILPGLTSGNLQAVVYDLTSMEIYIAYGYMTDDKKYELNAYERPFIYLDMNKVFAEPQPTLEEIEQQ